MVSYSEQGILRDEEVTENRQDLVKLLRFILFSLYILFFLPTTDSEKQWTNKV